MKGKILSLAVVLLMMAAAAICVNKRVFGHELSGGIESETSAMQESGSTEAGEIITESGDGSFTIHTSLLEGQTDGYAGPVGVDIHVDKEGRITKVEPLPNSETPAFFSRAAVLTDSWVGKTPKEALETHVDAVSGATYSSTALINNVRAGLSYYEGMPKGTGNSAPWKIWVALGVTLAACIVPLFVRNRIYNTVQLIANVVVLGFWCGQFLDYSLMLKYISSGISLPAGLVAISMLVAAFIYPLFGKAQHYCNHICPLGSAQMLVAEVCSYKLKLTPKVLKGLDWFRKILWGLLMILLWTDCLTGWMDLELFQAFQFESAATGIIIAAGVFVALSAIVSRPYCRFVCPTGSLFKRAENIG